MVDYLSSIENREERSKQARAVISVMGNLNPFLRDTADYNHKLWDHLFIMSGFTLDVDSPYPIPTAETLAPMPEKLKYPDKRIAIKHYGKNIEKIIKSLNDEDDRQAVEEVLANVARYMRAKGYEYNQEHPNNEVIIKDIKKMSNNTIIVDETAINNIKSDYKQTPSAHHKKAGFTNPRQNKAKNTKGNQPGGKNHPQNHAQKQHRNRPK